MRSKPIDLSSQRLSPIKHAHRSPLNALRVNNVPMRFSDASAQVTRKPLCSTRMISLFWAFFAMTSAGAPLLHGPIPEHFVKTYSYDQNGTKIEEYKGVSSKQPEANGILSLELSALPEGLELLEVALLHQRARNRHCDQPIVTPLRHDREYGDQIALVMTLCPKTGDPHVGYLRLIKALVRDQLFVISVEAKVPAFVDHQAPNNLAFLAYWMPLLKQFVVCDNAADNNCRRTQPKPARLTP